MKFLAFNTTFICEEEAHITYNSICDNLANCKTIIHEESADEYIVFTIKPDSVLARSYLATTVTVKFLSEGSQTKVCMLFRLHKSLEWFLKIYSILLILIESVLTVLLIATQLSAPALLFVPILLEGVLLLVSISGLYLGSRKVLDVVTQWTVCVNSSKKLG